MKTILSLFLGLITVTGLSQTIDLEVFATGLSSPVEITNAGDERLFVAEQGGLIRIVNTDGSVNPNPFLNISSMISNGGERGLLGLAFHPDYDSNGFFYVNYTDTSGNTVISRFTVSATDENAADAGSEVVMLEIEQPFSNHNGGCMHFGPDGYLYISTGDGGSGGVPQNNAQNIDSLLGKMLRINVEDDGTYSIPTDNPFVGEDGLDEIWAYGLRNAWKFSFDSSTGDLWIADVGQGAIEEINMAESTAAGLNYGWRCYEGSEIYDFSQCNGGTVFTLPVAEYTHNDTGGCSVTGGYVYNGTTYPGLQGMYIFADYCNNQIGMLDGEGNITYSQTFSGNNLTAFGENIDNELFVGGKTSGTIYRVVDSELGITDFGSTAFAVYPNPATEEIFLKNSGQNVASNLYIYDLSGKLLIETSLENNLEVNRVDVSQLSSGIYMIALVEENGAKHNVKLSVK